MNIKVKLVILFFIKPTTNADEIVARMKLEKKDFD